MKKIMLPSIYSEYPNFVITAKEGYIQPIHAKNPKKGFSLDEMQQIVGGYIQMVDISGRRKMVLNEEGKIHGLSFNEKATHFWEEKYGKTDMIVGNVLIMTRGGKE